ncbi:NmrA family NAD(P)-binding protein [Argonema galeatum]|uniref:NmrA family NAD(P)-binding protein n=1 Tax=Argonema galeatum TaxID=2942762 RepID=UPI00201288AE|nr:NmrA family NAD(P)-binding protein [Argonema galeatum]MCL1464083.1 NmrA family NAD(P)-binding protein [Argonema galeatum A003/A1]
MSQKDIYVVLGATGQTGGAVANTLIEHGASVRVVVRNASKGESWAQRGAEVAVADVTDVGAMTQAFSGAKGAYLLNPPDYQADDMFAVAENVGVALQEAVQNAGLSKLVVLSSVGAHLPEGTGNIRTTWIFEQRFRQIDLPIAFVRCAYFMENWASVASVAASEGVMPSFLSPLDRAIPMVAAADIGRVCAESLLETWSGTRTIELQGPQSYSPNDVAAGFAQALGRPVQAVEVPESDWAHLLAQFGNSPGAIVGWSEMLRGFNTGHIIFEDEGTTHLKGRVTIEDAIGSFIPPS